MSRDTQSPEAGEDDSVFESTDMDVMRVFAKVISEEMPVGVLCELADEVQAGRRLVPQRTLRKEGSSAFSKVTLSNSRVPSCRLVAASSIFRSADAVSSAFSFSARARIRRATVHSGLAPSGRHCCLRTQCISTRMIVALK